MRFFKKLSKLFSVVRPAKGKRVQARSNQVQLRLEELERREMLSATWYSVGPGQLAMDSYGNIGGRVNALVVSDNYDGTGKTALFAGTSGGGIWRSDNFTGNTPIWTPLTDALTTDATTGDGFGELSIGAMAVSPTKPNFIVAGTGANREFFTPGAGVLWSFDGGATWSRSTGNKYIAPEDANSQSYDEFVGLACSAILFNPSNPDQVFAAFEDSKARTNANELYKTGGIYRGVFEFDSNNKPTDIVWTKLTNFNINTTTLQQLPMAVTDLKYYWDAPNNTKYLDAGVVSSDSANSGVWRSTDDGATWNPIFDNTHLSGNATGGTITRVGITANYIAAVATSVAQATKGQVITSVLKSNDAITWQDLNAPVNAIKTQPDWNLSFGLSPDDGTTLYLGGSTEMWRYDGTWKEIQSSANLTTHPDHHGIAFWGGKVYDGNDGGVYRYDPVAKSWVSANGTGTGSLIATQLYSFDLARNTLKGHEKSFVAIAGSQDNGGAVLKDLWVPYGPATVRAPWKSATGGDATRVLFSPNGKVAYMFEKDGVVYEASVSDSFGTWKSILTRAC